MPQSLRPQSIQLRKAPSIKDYRQDIGNIHIVDYYLHREVKAIAALYHASIKLPEQRIGRYLDGEEEREGLYR
jgi:hypothetical protein